MSNNKLEIEQLKFKRDNREFYPLTTAEAVIFNSDDERLYNAEESIHGAIMELFLRLKALEEYYQPLTQKINDLEEKHEVVLNPRIVDNLVCESRIRALSARQGVILKDLVDSKLGFEILSQAKYDGITVKEANKIYFINDGMKIRKFYIGEYLYDPNSADDPVLKLEYNAITVPASTTNISPVAIQKTNIKSLTFDAPEGCTIKEENGKLVMTVPRNLTVVNKTYVFEIIGKAFNDERDITVTFTVNQLHEEHPSAELFVDLNTQFKQIVASAGTSSDIVIESTNCSSFDITAPSGCSATINDGVITYSWPINLTQSKKLYEFIVYGYNEDLTASCQTSFTLEQARGGSEEIEFIIEPDVFNVISAAGHTDDAAVKVLTTGAALSVSSWPQWINNVEYHEPSRQFHIEWAENESTTARTAEIEVVATMAGKKPVSRKIVINQLGSSEGAFMDWDSYDFTASGASMQPVKFRLPSANTNCVTFRIDSIAGDAKWYNNNVTIFWDQMNDRWQLGGTTMGNQSGKTSTIKVTGETANGQTIQKTFTVTLT